MADSPIRTGEPWWLRKTVYQIYPRSFCDSNGDGIGDLKGITSKLDHLAALGVGIVWLSPIYASPNDDNGYDISDYRQVMTEFGTMADFDEMLAAMHERGIALVMDLVVNHTSDEHEWFREAASSKDNPYRDYYIWRTPGPNGEPPNNWESYFLGSTWEPSEATGEMYLHLFTRKQPDLNWENPEVRAEVHDLMRFWLDKGVDGFRMDVINLISKQPGLPDAPVVGPGPWQPSVPTRNGPRFMEYMQEMNAQALAAYRTVTVGETPHVAPRDAIRYTNPDTGVLDMVFGFEHMDVDCQGWKWNTVPVDLTALKRITTRWQTEMHGQGWNSLYLCNHDQPRSVSRFGDDGSEFRVRSAKMLATWLHLQQGTPYVYQGEELGMTNVAFGSIEEYRDVEIHNFWRQCHERGENEAWALGAIHSKGRDNARTPVQWDATANAGFTTGTPWIGVNPNYPTVNAAAALADPDSVFHHYRKLIVLRSQLDVITHGSFELIQEAADPLFAYLRTLGSDRLLVACNFSGGVVRFVLPDPVPGAAGEVLITNVGRLLPFDVRSIELEPWEGLAVLLT